MPFLRRAEGAIAPDENILRDGNFCKDFFYKENSTLFNIN